ncbi:hypothetical protein AVEN_202549-1 [Araneus ventricosus]|uniref:Uncharacterized protein n=1 Tax=Araneus ventricosus TaxID=182803 RepID=A0A4Y2IQA4_ARAVE|nr:hypothetical protein AVEN_202549-1 [Araneus ventricosus]
MRSQTLDAKDADKSEDFTINFKVPIKVNKIALKSMKMWSSWFNIHEKFNNHILKYIYKGVEHQIKFDNGNYMMSELNEEYQDHFGIKKPPIELDVHQATSRFVIKLDTGYAIDFTGYELDKILGFEEKNLRSTKAKSKIYS